MKMISHERNGGLVSNFLHNYGATISLKEVLCCVY